MWQNRRMFQEFGQFDMPPGFMQVPGMHNMVLIQRLKADAEKALDNKQFPSAAKLYSDAIRIASQAPADYCGIQEELCRLYSNRSLVYTKMRKFKQALDDANNCTQKMPNWTKGYWRKAQACKGLKDEYLALHCLLQGYKCCMVEDPDIVYFLAEIIATICLVQDDARQFLDNTEAMLMHQFPELVLKVLHRLASNNQWEGVSLLVLGRHSGPRNSFEYLASSINAQGISVGSLIQNVPVPMMRKWGSRLAMALINNGASVEDMEMKLSKPALHIGVTVALDAGEVDLLKFLLDFYIKSSEKKNIQDSNGNTGLHLLVQSNRINTTLGETILRLLLNNGCSAIIINKAGKTPIQYLKPKDQGYALMQAAEKAAVEELRGKIAQLKEEGNRAHRDQGYPNKAVELYTEAMSLCERYPALQNEMAVLLTNRSAVYSIQGRHQEAYKDAENSIKIEPGWYKGYWRKGQILRTLENYQESFFAFLSGYRNGQFSETKGISDIKISFLSEAVVSLQCLHGENKTFNKLYEKLRELTDVELNLVIVKLSKAGEWQAIRILVLGSDEMLVMEMFSLKSFGIAANVSSQGACFSTVFPFLRQHMDDGFTCTWLTKLLIVLLENGGGLQNFLSFVENEGDTPLHAAVKFSLMAGNISILSDLPAPKEASQIVDLNGDSVFHIITKKPPTKNNQHLLSVAKVLLEKGFSANVKDRNGKMPIDYLKPGEKQELFDLLLGQYLDVKDKGASTTKPAKSSKPQSNPKSVVVPANIDASDPIKLKEHGNKEFKQRNFTKAVQLYTKAIELTPPDQSVNLARLFGNRFECWLRLKEYDHALNDALESVSHDGHWYKSHFRVGKAMTAMGKGDAALKAFINSYNALETDASEGVKREVLFEFCVQHIKLHEAIIPITSLKNLTKDVWLKTAYDLVCKKQMEAGFLAYSQLNVGDLATLSVVLDLQPLCNLNKIEEHKWIVEMIHRLLTMGSDHQSLIVQHGDKYLHAVVKMTLVVEFDLLLVYVIQRYSIPLNELDIVDHHGNTALHVATRDSRCRPHIRLMVVSHLLQNDLNAFIKNNDGRLAIEYLPKYEGLCIATMSDVMNSQMGLVKQLKQQKKKEVEKVKLLQEQEERREKERQQQLKQQREQEERRREKERQQQQCKKQEQERRQQQEKQREENVYWKMKGFCRTCESYLEEGKEHLSKMRTYKAYTSLASVLRHKGDREIHKKMFDETLSLIVNSLANTLNPEIPEKLARIPVGLYQRMLDGLAELEKYKQMDIAVTEFRKHHGDMALRDFAKNISIAKVIRHRSMLGQNEMLSKLVDNMLNSGAVLDKGGKMSLLAAIQEEHYKLVCMLFERGADPEHLSLQQGDTPLHAALSIALERDKGNFSILNKLLDMYENNPEKYPMLDPSIQDENGDGLFHLVAKMKYNSTTQKATELLCDRKISALIKNKEGKFPKDYLMNKKTDRRLQFFRLASVDTSSKQSLKKPKSKVEKVQSGLDAEKIAEGEEMVTDKHEDISSSTNETYTDSKPEKITRKDKRAFQMKGTMHREATKRKIEEMIFSLPDVPYSIFNPKTPHLEEGWKTRKPLDDQAIDTNSEVKTDKKETEQQMVVEAVDTAEAQQVEPQSETDQDDAEEQEEETDQPIEAETFDNLEWEVECTAEVWKTLRDNHVLPELKHRVIKKIQQLAKGEWRKSLCHKIGNVPNTLHLYEAKLSKGSRIIWELAIAFSPRLSETAERRLKDEGETEDYFAVKGGRIYSEIIRVWDVVFDHNKLYRAVQKIIKSHNRGEECIIQKKLKGVKQTQFQAGAGKRYPMVFAETDTDLGPSELKECQEDVQQYFPPASSNETEYHILKFYSFSSNLVHHILQNIETKVDFPFRVTDLEHAIINLQSQAPILLLGRSGTGKTTCCLYRLWTQFMKYWYKATEADGPLLPRCPAFVVQEVDPEEDPEEQDAENEEKEELDEEVICAEGVVIEEEVPEEENQGQIYDHLHQIFITKNAVLCSEVQKNFRELSHASSIAVRHIQMEDTPLPPRLQDVEHYQYPLFITSKKLLLMMDASLGQPYFFERADDGSLKVDIQGWTDGEGILSILPLLAEESDDEDEEDGQFDDIPDDDDMEDDAHQNRRAKVKVDPRREVTYEVFSNEVWPKIAKKFAGKYHPSLIWTEIMSFIKGSFEALSKSSGFLTKEEYFELGKKRAPNFSGHREHIYELFKRYDHFKKMKFLFDETDLVRHVYTRLKRVTEMTWVIHQIFVDETQDFTQAELCLLLRICQNPNQMFLTGDTAQSIMRGIAFRFNDLKSLFFYAKQSMHALGDTSDVEVPKKVHQLTHNYRSHAGILALASSILDLMVRFFPESFDRLQKDQGLFHGPQPVLLESCSFSDLAVLLRGNRRKTSHIEFGAHQAILVVDETARDSIPEELHLGLVLTIYEAKGLEFDDILLYNFFKDSQAVKEWRVVTEYLEEMAALTAQDKTRPESLVEIDAGILQQSGRPRPLKFDPNHHKVLNSELKHLYTAVTRARVNVWIFDEDMEKRAPMFEYFKARKLIKTLTSTDVDTDNIGGVFAEESSQKDWIKRGEDFMKHALYEVARKCFSRGGDDQLVKVAEAHQQALIASRTKDSHQHMRDEFLLAGEKFLDCGLPSQAAKCLVNARERELVAHLYEKLGQLERAAETYRRLKRPVEGSRCYEQLGMFNRAMDTLCENEFYEMAIDTLVRYEKLVNRCKKESEKTGTPVPVVLKDNAPSTHHTQERLSYKAAIHNHKTGNEIRMLANLDRLPQLTDRIDFLKTHGYFDRAAELLQKEGKFTESAHLYLMHGKTTKAIESARQSSEKDLLARSLLIHVQVIMRQKQFASEERTPEEKESEKQELLQHLQAAIDLSLKCGNHDIRGEACFLKGELTDEITDINESWGAFNKSKPYRNEAGQLECMHWMVNNSPLNQTLNCKQVVKGMQNLFGVLNIVLSPSNLDEKARLERVFNYYGFELVNQNAEVLKLYPLQKPRAFHMVKRYLTKTDKKKSECEVPKEVAKLEICRYLLERGHKWFGKVDLAVHNLRRMRVQCRSYLFGTECEEEKNEGSCRYRHEPETRYSWRDLLEIDTLMMELDSYIMHGTRKILRNIPELLIDKVKVFSPDELENPLAKFRSCEHLLQDLMPRHYHSWQILGGQDGCRETRRQLITKHFIKDHVLKYLRARFDHMQSTERMFNTDVFQKLIFLTSYFDLSKEVKPNQVMMQFENSVLGELSAKDDRYRAKKKLEPLGFIVETHTDDITRRSQTVVQCIARRFWEAFYQLTVRGDMMESLIKFTKYVVILGDRNKTAILPEIHEFMMWIEFYTTVCLCFAAKLKQGSPFFFLPSSYICNVNFIDSAFMYTSGAPSFELIQRYKPSWKSNGDVLVQDRLRRILSILCGVETKMNLIRLLFKVRDDRPMDYPVAERLLILCLTCLCNMGRTIYVDKEANIMQMLCKIRLPLDCPPRLLTAVRFLQEAEGQIDLAQTLMQLLSHHKEKIQLCTWHGDRYGLRYEPLQKLSSFKQGFYDSRTPTLMSNPSTEVTKQEDDEDDTDKLVEDTGLSMEEKLKWETEKQNLQQEEKENNAAFVITRWCRHRVFIKKCKVLQSLLLQNIKREKEEEWMKIFKIITVDDISCGICGMQYNSPLIKEQHKHTGDVDHGQDITPVFVNQTLSPEELKSNPFASLVLDDGVERRQNLQRDTVVGDSSTKEYGNKVLRYMHEESGEHKQKVFEFSMLQSKYREEIAPKLEIVGSFIRKHKLNEETMAKNYPNMALEIQRLVGQIQAVQKEVENIVANRSWGNYGPLIQKSKEMEGTYQYIRNYVEAEYKVLQEEAEKKASMLASSSSSKMNVQDEDWEPDLMEIIDPVVEEPKEKPRNKKIFKGRGRARFVHGD